MDCMLFTFKKKSSAHAVGASVVWHLSLSLMNSFNKTKAAIFLCRLCFLRVFPFLSLRTQNIPVRSPFHFLKLFSCLVLSNCLLNNLGDAESRAQASTLPGEINLIKEQCEGTLGPGSDLGCGAVGHCYATSQYHIKIKLCCKFCVHDLWINLSIIVIKMC